MSSPCLSRIVKVGALMEIYLHCISDVTVFEFVSPAVQVVEVLE